ncbi:unnamed protein product [Pleuronectes platessa]|uniref:Uncharacterized protein n=1 Tax=Pleuronectes platessa TaxID=8262 RepID=A0A9N7Z1T6_PLEPL|nr:unnamed protein product [Pleuronectes platessa]
MSPGSFSTTPGPSLPPMDPCQALCSITGPEPAFPSPWSSSRDPVHLPGPGTLASHPLTLILVPYSHAGPTTAVAPSPSSPRRRLSVRHREVLIRWRLMAPALKAGRWRGTGYAVSGGHSGRVSGPSRGSPQLRRPLGEPSGWRLAAD